jgi:glycerol kinase
MPQVIAIDQSTSATKALVYDSSGRLIEKSSLEHRQIYPQPGWVEHDANEIWQNTLAVLGQLQTSEPACLSITNQRETIVIFDRETGEPLVHALVWQDRRGEPICRELASHNANVTWKTGLRIDPYFSASKLTWLMRNRPEIARRVADGSALIGTIDTYLIYRLTRGSVFATDASNACRTLLFDISSLCWDQELCRLFEVPPAALAEVRDSTAYFGHAQVGGREWPICGVMGDSQASLFAHRCFEPGMAKVTIGSGSSVLLNMGSKLEFAADAGVSTIAWVHGGRPTYCFEGIINYAAATIQWLKDQLGLIHDPAESESAAGAVKDNGGVYLVPAFSGLSAPHWAPSARAAIVGLTSHAGRNHVIRAALESIGYQIRDVLDAMRSGANVPLQTIHADGGATQNRFLMQFIADMTNLKVTAARIPDCSPLGAAMAGMLGKGIHRSLDDLTRLAQESTIFSPTMPAVHRDQLYSGWRHAVKQVLAGAEA